MEKTEIDAASSLAVARPGLFQHARSHAVDASRFYDPQQACVPARATKPELTTFAIHAKKIKKIKADAIAYGPSARQSSTRDHSQHA